MVSEFLSTPSIVLLLLSIPPIVLTVYHTILNPHRPARILDVSPRDERVVILGASSGIGESIAQLYAKRGARVSVVARRKDKIDRVRDDCTKLGATGIIALVGDFANVEDMVRVRDTVKQDWGGIDTLVIAAGVSSLKPLLEIGAVMKDGGSSHEGIQHTRDVSAAAVTGNFYGPLVSAVTFIPLLQSTSPRPSILLVSSLAAAIPAPTRALYAATKSASLQLFRALAIEHPQISFSNVLPSTVEGDFRVGAVDGGDVRESAPNKTGLKRLAVAERCIKAIDRGEKTVYMPWLMNIAPFLYLIWPSFVEKKASRKYKFA